MNSEPKIQSLINTPQTIQQAPQQVVYTSQQVVPIIQPVQYQQVQMPQKILSSGIYVPNQQGEIIYGKDHDLSETIKIQSNRIVYLEDRIDVISKEYKRQSQQLEFRSQELDQWQRHFQQLQNQLNTHIQRVRELEQEQDQVKNDNQKLIIGCEQRETQIKTLNQNLQEKTREVNYWKQKASENEQVQQNYQALQHRQKFLEQEGERIQGNQIQPPQIVNQGSQLSGSRQYPAHAISHQHQQQQMSIAQPPQQFVQQQQMQMQAHPQHQHPAQYQTNIEQYQNQRFSTYENPAHGHIHNHPPNERQRPYSPQHMMHERPVSPQHMMREGTISPQHMMHNNRQRPFSPPQMMNNNRSRLFSPHQQQLMNQQHLHQQHSHSPRNDPNFRSSAYYQ